MTRQCGGSKNASGLGQAGLTLPELMIAMGLFTLFLVVSAQVVNSYAKAYHKMDKALPSKRSLFHLFEALTRELAGVEAVSSPSLQSLQDGVFPSWEEPESHLIVTQKRLDAAPEVRSFAYFHDERGIVCFTGLPGSESILPLPSPTPDIRTDPNFRLLGQSGQLWIQWRLEHGRPLLKVRLYPLDQGGPPAQTMIPLSPVCLQPNKGQGAR